MEIGQIIKGHVNEVLNLNQDISQVRKQICKKCPIFKDFMGGICNPKLWLNPKTGEVSTYSQPGFIRGCGCRLNAKTTLKNGHCPAGKW